MLARRFPLLLCTVVRPCAGVSQFWSGPPCLAHAQPFVVRRGLPPTRPRRLMTGSRTLHSMLWRLALVAFVLGLLALHLPDVASLSAGEATGLLRAMAPGPGASLVFSLAEERPLATVADLSSPPDARFTPDGSDVDNDDSSAIPLLIRRVDFLPPAPVGIDLNGSTHACFWPAHYLVRPQLLSRL
jgi:hypothetical protein